jgi:hypothetical protein
VSHPPFRILVFDLPPLLRDLVTRALDANEDMTTVVADQGSLDRAVADERPNVVIVPMDDGELGATGRGFLQERAGVRVLGLGVRDGRVVLYELLPRRSELGTVVPDEVASVIRPVLARGVAV